MNYLFLRDFLPECNDHHDLPGERLGIDIRRPRTRHTGFVCNLPMGVGVTPRPRPAGRSGCVTTCTTRCEDASKAQSDGKPNSPLPAKMIFMDDMH